MEILLITGFLGAGKTTLLNHLLCSGFNEKAGVAVIVNEAGRVGIDGTVIRKRSGLDINLMELTSGCICCTLKNDFLDAVKEIHKTVNPACLIVEATGIAQPGEMFDILSRKQLTDFSYLKSVITVVDADFFEAREVLDTFYDNQIKCADIIILNKTDKVDENELEQIKKVIYDLNPASLIIPAQHCAVDPDILLEPQTEQNKNTIEDHSHQHEQGGFRSFTFEARQPMDKEKLDRFLEALSPSIFRCKGWVHFIDGSELLNYTGGGFSYEALEEDHDTTLVFIGRNLDEKGIAEDLEKCFL